MLTDEDMQEMSNHFEDMAALAALEAEHDAYVESLVQVAREEADLEEIEEYAQYAAEERAFEIAMRNL
ncbi:MAG: hypothetical protein ACM3UO_00275 [Bacillota bacterium]